MSLNAGSSFIKSFCRSDVRDGGHTEIAQSNNRRVYSPIFFKKNLLEKNICRWKAKFFSNTPPPYNLTAYLGEHKNILMNFSAKRSYRQSVDFTVGDPQA